MLTYGGGSSQNFGVYSTIPPVEILSLRGCFEDLPTPTTSSDRRTEDRRTTRRKRSRETFSSLLRVLEAFPSRKFQVCSTLLPPGTWTYPLLVHIQPLRGSFKLLTPVLRTPRRLSEDLPDEETCDLCLFSYHIKLKYRTQ